MNDAPQRRSSLPVSFLRLDTLNSLLTYKLGNNQDEATHCQELLEANRMERARCTEHKCNKASGIDRPAQSDDEEQPDSTVFFFLLNASNYF